MKSVIEVIHGFDPSGHDNGTTGYVKFCRDTQSIIELGAFTRYQEVFQILNNIDLYRDMVIFEKNHGIMKVQSQFEMCKMVGFIEGLCESKGIIYQSQSPTVRKGFVNMAKKYLKTHHKNYVIHNIDALAHILRFINKNEGLKEEIKCL